MERGAVWDGLAFVYGEGWRGRVKAKGRVRWQVRGTPPPCTIPSCGVLLRKPACWRHVAFNFTALPRYPAGERRA